IKCRAPRALSERPQSDSHKARASGSGVMKTNSGREYCLIVEGAYLSQSEAEHALRDPFIEEWVEETGRFRIHNLNEMEIVPGVVLGALGIEMLDEELFEIASTDPERPLTEHKARGVAEALRRHDMFDEITVEPRAGRQSVVSDCPCAATVAQGDQPLHPSATSWRTVLHLVVQLNND